MLAQIAARMQLELLTGEDIPELATQLLLAGYDNQPLRELAGESSATLRDHADRFREGLALCGAPSLTGAEAATIFALELAARIQAGAPPYRTAMEAHPVWWRFPDEELLGVFYGLAVGCDDLPEQRESIEAEIRECAARAVASAGPHAS